MSEWRDLALQKIGRNLVNLSKTEGMLKSFLSRINFQCSFSELETTLEAKKKKYENMTLGQVSQHYFKTYNLDPEPLHQFPEDRKDDWFALSFTTETESLAIQKKYFEFMVEQRNKLVHELLVRFDTDSEQDCKELVQKLDDQNQNIKRQYNKLVRKLQDMEDAIKLLMQEHSGLLEETNPDSDQTKK